MVPEKTLESPLVSKEIKLVNLKGNQPWILFVRTVAEAEAPMLWTLYVNSWLIRKDPDTWKDWRQKENSVTKDEMVGWHHRLNGRESEQSLGVGDRQGSLVCCSPWGRKELGTHERLNNSKTTPLLLILSLWHLGRCVFVLGLTFLFILSRVP